jgi:hypothetical protein
LLLSGDEDNEGSLSSKGIGTHIPMAFSIYRDSLLLVLSTISSESLALVLGHIVLWIVVYLKRVSWSIESVTSSIGMRALDCKYSIMTKRTREIVVPRID